MGSVGWTVGGAWYTVQCGELQWGSEVWIQKIVLVEIKVSYVLCISKMSRKFETVLFFLLLSATTRADTENEVAPSNEDTESFPSISSISRNDGSFSIPQPSLDLAPTDLAENSPMSFSIPSLELQLDETDFAKNAPMSFSITQPELDLKPSFAFEGLDQAPEQDDVAIKEKKLELEKEEVNNKNTTRKRRQGLHFSSSKILLVSIRKSNKQSLMSMIRWSMKSQTQPMISDKLASSTLDLQSCWANLAWGPPSQSCQWRRSKSIHSSTSHALPLVPSLLLLILFSSALYLERLRDLWDRTDLHHSILHLTPSTPPTSLSPAPPPPGLPCPCPAVILTWTRGQRMQYSGGLSGRVSTLQFCQQPRI